MENIGKLYTKHYNPDHHHCGSHLIFSEGALIPTHQSGKALYYNSIKTELKSPQKADQKKGQQQQQKQQQQNQQQQQQNQQQQGKATKVVFSNGGVNTALHDGAEHATAPNGKLLEKASNENGKVVENGNHGKFKPENSDNVSDDSRREKGTVQSCAKGGELPVCSLTNGHFAKSSDVNRKADDDVNVALNGHSNGGSSNFSSNCSSPTNGLSSLPTPRRSLPSTRYSASVARERELESECQSETSSVLTTSTPVNCSPHVQRRTEEEEAVRAV